ncbi:MAG: Arc family DNA-binding protein [Roseovarius sp.]|nr:Arc family DNA-binding protein [Roseovarius sp.]
MSDYPSQKQDKFVLRLPEGLRDRIKAAAERNGRSMNAEIVQLLERQYPEPMDLPSDQIEAIRALLVEYESEEDPKKRLGIRNTIAQVALGKTFVAIADGSF